MSDLTRPAVTAVAPAAAPTRRRRGTGSIYHDGDSWMACVRSLDGRKLRRRAKDRADARSRLAQLLKEQRPMLSREYRYWMDVAKRKRREGLRPSVRFEVLQRDRFRCVYCGATAKTTTLQVDHVLAVVRGGSDDLTNLVTACLECNIGKGDRELAITAPQR